MIVDEADLPCAFVWNRGGDIGKTIVLVDGSELA